jgi:DNA repair photolyase
MRKGENKLAISGQYLHCPLFISIDTYEGCPHGCRYCLARVKYEKHSKGKPRSELIRPSLLTAWERVLNGECINNPMIEYLIDRKHPIQLGTKADPFPKRVEKEIQNTRKFIELCNAHNYPVYICTKNPDPQDMPIELLAKGNYVLAVSILSHKPHDIRWLEKHTSEPGVRLKQIKQIPKGVFKKIIVRWHPFIPQLFRSARESDEKIAWQDFDHYLDEIAGSADAVAMSFLSTSLTPDKQLLEEIGPDDLTELEELEILTYIKQQTHKRKLEFYTASYRALSDSPICCGLRGDEFKFYTTWVWAFLIWKLYSGEKEYLTEKDIIEAFPDVLKNTMFSTMDVPLYSRWARYCAKKTTILEEYINTFTTDRKKNPVNFFAGLYSRVVDGEYRVYFKDYRQMVNA